MGQDPLLKGPEFQVNTYTTAGQNSPSVSSDGLGGFFVVWSSEGSLETDQDSSSIQGQRLSSIGASLGSQFQINSSTVGHQSRPKLAFLGTSGFVVVWHSASSAGPDGDAESIQGQRLDSTGLPLAAEFQVNTYGTSEQSFPSVSGLESGEFLVVWRSFGSDGSDDDSSIQAQFYDSSGNPSGLEFQVNDYTTGTQASPEVASLSDGRFVMVWTSEGSYGTDSDTQSIQGKVYHSNGDPVGDEFQVNSYTSFIQRQPTVVGDDEGGFIVVWNGDGSAGTDDDLGSIHLQRFDSSGSTLGGEPQVNSYTISNQTNPDIAFTEGQFLISWYSEGSSGNDSSLGSIQGQMANSEGAQGGEFQVNTYTTSNQNSVAVSQDSNGGFIAVWQSLGSSGSDDHLSGILAQRISPSLFADGFESGDTSGWSSTQF